MIEVYSFISKGGYLVIPIILASLFGLTIFFERLFFLRRKNIIPENIVREVLPLISSGKFDEALEIVKKDGSIFSNIVRQALLNQEFTRNNLKEIIEEHGTFEVKKMEKNLKGLGAVFTISPLLGLLGTVTGMIQVFREVEKNTNPSISQLAGGIWEALLTTAMGLTVAIIVYVGYRFLVGKIDRYSQELEELAVKILNMIKGGKE